MSSLGFSLQALTVEGNQEQGTIADPHETDPFSIASTADMFADQHIPTSSAWIRSARVPGGSPSLARVELSAQVRTHGRMTRPAIRTKKGKPRISFPPW